jgi:HAD superfamily hydrolase (TIGR01490 family)
MSRSEHSAAVFDLDGTLIRGTSAERLLVPWLVRRRVIGPRQLGTALARLASLPLRGRTVAVRRNKRWLADVPVEDVLACMQPFLDERLMPRLRPMVLERMDRLRARGARTWLLTGAPDFVARAVAERLGMDGWAATALEVVRGRFTGEIAGRHVFGEAKREALTHIAAAHALDLRASSGFADHGSDIAFLECFGHAVAVSPDRRLRRVARGRGWDVLR